MNVSSSCWFRSDGLHFKVSLRHKPRRTWRILFRRENCGWSVVCLIPLQLLLRATLCGCVRVKQHSTRCAYCICVCVCVCVRSFTLHTYSALWLCISCTYAILCSCLSLSLCVSPHARSISCCFPHTDAGVGLGWVVVVGGGEGSAVAALVPVARRESAPRPPPQPITTMQEAPGPMRRPSEAVGRRSGSSWEFFRLISQWGCCVSDIKAGNWSYFQPSCSLSPRQSVGLFVVGS